MNSKQLFINNKLFLVFGLILASISAIATANFIPLEQSNGIPNNDNGQHFVPDGYQQISPSQLEFLQKQLQQADKNGANMELDDDDDDDDLQPMQMSDRQLRATSGTYQSEQPLALEQTGAYQVQGARASDLKPAASKHYHHGHGAKGWLEMGAWTGKKGAFGWHDKHPVGKGRR